MAKKQSKFSIPLNMTEKEVLDIIDRVAKKLANKFKFGYHETADMEQEARYEALKGIARYDGVRPLENYLWTHVHNRLFNFKRDNYFRPYCPCLKCDDCFVGECKKYDNQTECFIFTRWINQNIAKLNIIHPLEFSCVDDDNENKMSNSIVATDYLINDELKKVLDQHIPLEHRHNYLKLISGCRLQTKYKEPLLQIIREIIDEHYDDLSNDLSEDN